MPAGASSSHCGKAAPGFQPGDGRAVRCGRADAAPSTAAPSASRRGVKGADQRRQRLRYVRRPAAISSSKARGDGARLAAGCSGVSGAQAAQGARQPKALGTKGMAGPHESEQFQHIEKRSCGRRVPSRPATKAACATSTSPLRNSVRASSCFAMREPPSADASSAPPGAGTRAGMAGSSRNVPVALWSGFSKQSASCANDISQLQFANIDALRPPALGFIASETVHPARPTPSTEVPVGAGWLRSTACRRSAPSMGCLARLRATAFSCALWEHEALIDIHTFEVIEGNLPGRALSLMLEWASVTARNLSRIGTYAAACRR